MSSTEVQAIAGFGSALVGAVVGAAIAAYKASQRIKEIELTFAHDLRESYLSNAREYKSTVYVPLAIAMMKLTRCYHRFIRELHDADTVPGGDPSQDFRDGINTFLTEIDDLIDRGAIAYLTTELETYLLSFRDFIKSSRDAVQPLSKVVIGYSVNIFGSNLHSERSFKVSGRRSSFLMCSFGISTLGVGVRLSRDQLLSAPIESNQFSERYTRDNAIMNQMIKVVTLGSHARVIES